MPLRTPLVLALLCFAASCSSSPPVASSPHQVLTSSFEPVEIENPTLILSTATAETEVAKAGSSVTDATKRCTVGRFTSAAPAGRITFESPTYASIAAQSRRVKGATVLVHMPDGTVGCMGVGYARDRGEQPEDWFTRFQPGTYSFYLHGNEVDYRVRAGTLRLKVRRLSPEAHEASLPPLDTWTYAALPKTPVLVFDGDTSPTTYQLVAEGNTMTRRMETKCGGVFPAEPTAVLDIRQNSPMQLLLVGHGTKRMSLVGPFQPDGTPAPRAGERCPTKHRLDNPPLRYSTKGLAPGRYLLRVGPKRDETPHAIRILVGPDALGGAAYSPIEVPEANVPVTERMLENSLPFMARAKGTLELAPLHRQRVWAAAPSEMCVYPTEDLDAASAAPPTWERQPRFDFPRKGERLIWVRPTVNDRGEVIAADGSMFTIEISKLSTEPNGSAHLPDRVRNLGFIKGTKEAKLVVPSKDANLTRLLELEADYRDCYDAKFDKEGGNIGGFVLRRVEGSLRKVALADIAAQKAAEACRRDEFEDRRQKALGDIVASVTSELDASLERLRAEHSSK